MGAGVDIRAIGSEVSAAMRRGTEVLIMGGSVALARKLTKQELAWQRAVKAEIKAIEQSLLAKAEVSLTKGVLLVVNMPFRTVSEPNKREHWAKKHIGRGDLRPSVRMAMTAHANAKGLKVSTPCTVRLTRIAPGTLDDDNLRAALKAVRDGVADWLETDDSATGGVAWLYAPQEMSANYGIRVEVSR